MDDYFLHHVIGFTFVLSSIVSSAEQFLVIPSIKAKGSPGLNQEMTSVYERLHIHVDPRLYKYTHLLKLIVKATTAVRETSCIHVCFHRNSSLGIGMCSHHQWKKVSNGSWTKKMLPIFDYKILDIRVNGSSNVILNVYTEQECLMFHYLFIIIGAILFNFASTMSRSEVFYCAATSQAGIILAGLLLFFKVMKHLPNAQSRFGFFLYSFVLCLFYVIYVIFPYIMPKSESYKNLLRMMGFYRGNDRYTYWMWWSWLQIMGLFLGFEAMNSRLLLDEYNCIDTETSLYISWAIRVFAVILIVLVSFQISTL